MIIITDDIITDILNISQQDIQTAFSYQKEDVRFIDMILKRKDLSCPACGSSSVKIKEYRLRKINHSVFQFRKCTILYHARRFVCARCGKTFSYYKSRKKSILLIEKLRKYKMYIMMYELDRIT